MYVLKEHDSVISNKAYNMALLFTVQVFQLYKMIYYLLAAILRLCWTFYVYRSNATLTHGYRERMNSLQLDLSANPVHAHIHFYASLFLW